MSGIAGIVYFDGRSAEAARIEAMTSAMAYRGPDGIRHWVKGSVALGQCMLCTTPESLEETQPLTNENESIVLVMDGRIDNWEDLRRELLQENCELRTRADAELVLRAFERWGSNCLAYVEGDFALAIWDAKRQRLFCARDRNGNKPFYYFKSKDFIVFASELQAILKALPFAPELDQGTLAEYLANEWYSNVNTFWEGILRLPPANCLFFDRERASTQRYWAPDFEKDYGLRTPDDYAEYYKTLFADVVRRMTRSQSAIACEVSGGLDSSAILAQAFRLLRGGALLAPDIHSYTLDFEGVPIADELCYIRSLEEHLQIEVSRVAPSVLPIEWYRHSAIHYREFPTYPNAGMLDRLRTTAARCGARVLLNGVGGDEWLGMPIPGIYFREEISEGRWGNVLRCLREDIAGIGLRRVAWEFARFGVAPLLPARLKSATRPILRIVERLPTRPLLSSELESRLHERAAMVPNEDFLLATRAGQVSQLRFLHAAYDSQARDFEDRFTARLGIEMRSPFFNEEIIQFALSVPERIRTAGSITKKYHRRAMRGVLPEAIVNRPDKADFMCAFRVQLERLDLDLVDEIKWMRRAWFETDETFRQLTESTSPHRDTSNSWRLWTLVGCHMLLTGLD